MQELLGHADIESTARYTRVAAADLAKVIERCHPGKGSGPGADGVQTRIAGTR